MITEYDTCPICKAQLAGFGKENLEKNTQSHMANEHNTKSLEVKIDTVEKVNPLESLDSHSVSELKQLIKAGGISIPSGSKKSDLIELIQENFKMEE